ncbi:MAG: hypothetical protein CL570_03030 [Alphaproteobacteria bacterium]|nr:hypothetical protein [Alphaproteobacteria bacterium]HCQ70986.1 hypothetical protein [Rhodospirillaceae bacterium]|tara:strand:- start:7758 stop:8228 length:471 start_codon:yes stop_codon:yes gene_type:complete
MKQSLKTIDNTLQPIWQVMARLNCITLFVMRLYMADIFLKSGMLKVKSILNGQFDNVVYAFTQYHPVPFLPPNIAAILGTGGEIILPILLAAGFMGRLGAAGLLFMTCIIQFAVPSSYGIAHPQHYLWMMILAGLLFHGMGRISVDYWLAKWIRSK